MITKLVIASSVVMCLAGCSKKEPVQVTPPPERTKPVKPGTPMNLDKPDQVRIQLDLVQARSSIRLFKQTNGGKAPPNLDEVGVKFRFPDDIVYNPLTGRIHSKTYPGL